MNHLRWCPVCKKVTEGPVNTIGSEVKHIVGINKQPVYRAYCCVRPNGPENFHGPLFQELHIAKELDNPYRSTK